MYRSVRGESMYPQLKALDVCTTKEIDASRIKTGDIVVYKCKDFDILAVHRVLKVDRGNRTVWVKGDNIPSASRENIPFDNILEKVVEIKKETKTIDLESKFYIFNGKLLAFLSRVDLTPSLLKRKILDPVLLLIVSSPIFMFFRRYFYKDLYFAMTAEKEHKILFAFTGEVKNAEAVLETEDGETVFVSSYIRYRDRNKTFAGKFLDKILEISKKKYRKAQYIVIDDSILRNLTGLKDDTIELEKSGLLSNYSKEAMEFYPAVNFCFSALSAEMKLLLTCLGSNSHKTEEDIDWNLFWELSDYYMVVPLVYKNMQTMDIEPPETIKMKFREKSAQVFIRNNEKLENVGVISNLFSKNNIEVLFTKGASFVADFYGDTGLREFSDIDLLIKEESIEAIDEVLETEGYRPVDGSREFDKYRSQRLFSRDGRTFLDIHRGIMGRMLHARMLNMDPGQIWSDKRKITYNDISFYTLDHAHTLIYLCLHLAVQHSFMGLRGYVDIKMFIGAKKVDWDDFLDLVRRYKIRRPIYYSLVFAEKTVGARVPDDVIKQLEPVKRNIDSWIFNRIKLSDKGTEYLSELFMFDTLADTLKFILLSLIIFPGKFIHFNKIVARVVKDVFNKK